MSVGSNGFTDCNEICNPSNDMAWSCNEYCKDFVSVAPTSTTLPADHDETHVAVWIVLSGIGVLVVAVVITCYCYRKKIQTFIHKCQDKRLPYSIQEGLLPANTQAENGVVHVENKRTGLRPNQSGKEKESSNETSVPQEISSDSGVSSENSSVHTVDETT